MRTARSFAPILLAVLATACGGSSPTAAPTPPPGFPVSGFVFYDENANGVADPGETVRLPGVTVSIGGRTAQTTLGGRFTVDDVPAGAQTAAARPDGVPAYFTPGVPVNLTVPASGDVAVPAVLPLGSGAKPNVYVAFGDSITVGEGPFGGSYRDPLAADLTAYWGKATVLDEGQSSTRSITGQNRLYQALRHRPAYVLILYGTNDWNESECKGYLPSCYTVDALRSIALNTRADGAFPVLGTIPPVNPAYVDRQAEERNYWVSRTNDLVRAMAKQERVAIAEVHGDFLKQPSLQALFYDDKHPNDAGYAIIAQSFFNAITRPYGASTTARRDVLLRSFGGR